MACFKIRAISGKRGIGAFLVLVLCDAFSLATTQTSLFGHDKALKSYGLDMGADWTGAGRAMSN
jgi:hypothetical protein